MKLKNIIFVALTTYQLYVSDSYSKYIKEHYLDKNVHIICVGLERDNYTPPQEVDLIMLPNMNKTVFNRVIQRLVYGGRFFFLTSLKQIVRSSHTILFVFNDNEPITNKLVREVKKIRNNKVAIIEEGIGIYSHSNNNKLTIKQQIRYFFTSILGSPMQYKAIGDNPNINYAIVGNKNLYETLEKSRGQNVFAQNKNLLFSSTEDFLKRYLGTSFSYQRADIIYLGQPFDEYGKMLPDEEKCLEELFSLVEENKTILIKPHPRDACDKYENLAKKFRNVKVFSNTLSQLPIECLLKGLNTSVLFSFNSSAGVNIANSFPNIKSIFLIKTETFRPIHKYWNKIGAIYDDSIYNSKNNNTFLPMSDKQIMDLLKQNIPVLEEHQRIESNQFEEIENIIKNRIDGVGLNEKR